MKVIINFEGGGIRGVQSAIYAEFLEHVCGKPIHTLADLVAGTSTGALAAVALTGAMPKTGSQLVDLYEDRAAEIFSRPWHRRFTTLGGLIAPKYDNYNLLKVMTDTVGSGPLAGAKCNVMTTSYDLSTRAPAFHKSWKSNGVAAAFAAAASASAPTFFDPLNGHVDGGLFANDPTMCATVEARELFGVPFSDMAVLTFGTGNYDKPIKSNMAGAAVKDIVDCLLDGSEGVVHYQAQRTGFGAYLRLEAEPGQNPPSEMDDASPANIAQLSNVARKVVMKNTQNLLAWLKVAGLEK